MLDELGIQWSQPDGWQYRYEQVLRYYRQHGNVDIPAAYKTEDGIWLGNWLYHQRRAKAGAVAEKPLTPEQQKKLAELGL